MGKCSLLNHLSHDLLSSRGGYSCRQILLIKLKANKFKMLSRIIVKVSLAVSKHLRVKTIINKWTTKNRMFL